ncbi:MAG: TolC family protein, partial [Bacteroidota bacterium]|nr:TolC family protein [Bacteroidota bacterium]
DDAVRIGLEQNRALKISMLKAKSVGESRIKETEAERLPSLKLYGSYTRLSDIGPSIIAVPVPGVQPLSFQTYLLNNYSLRLSLLQPIFTGFRLQNIQNAAEHTSSAAQEDYKADQRGTIFTIKQQYWMLYRLQRTLDAVNKSLDESRARMVDIRSKLEKGLVLPNDTLKMQVQVSNNRLKKMQTEKDIRLASASLMNTLGLPLDEKVTLTTVANEVPPPQKSMAELIEIAKHRRSELKAIDERIEAARANVKIAKAGYWPQVSLEGNLYYADPNQRYFPVKDAFKTTWDASINLSWDVWTWNIAGLQAEQADYSVQQLQEVRKQTEEAIALEITQTYLTMQTGFAAIDIAKQAAEQARENLRIVNLQYSKGVATSLDVTSAETLTLDADINVATAITDANIGVAQMARVVGE